MCGFFRLLMLIILVSVFSDTGDLRAEVIETDTVWSGDIMVADKVVVDRDATLLIMPGSRVTFRPMPEGAEKGGGRLIVFGRLIAQGTEKSPIFFTSAATSPKAGDWEGLRFEQASSLVSRIDSVIIEYAQAGINGRYSSLQVAKSHFRNNKIGLVARNGLNGSLFDCLFLNNTVGVRFEQNDQLRLVDCRIKRNVKSGIVCSNSSPIIKNSSITDNGEYGIACLNGSSPLIENNLISGHQNGIRAEMNSSPTILHNEIVDNDTAIGLERLSFAIIEHNLIRQNRIGIFCHLGGYPHIHRNNIVDNQEFAIDLGTYQSIVVAREMPFDRRITMNLPVPGKNQNGPDKDLEVASAFPREGLIDAYGNWWGEESLDELQSGKTDNVSLFEDGFDTATLEYRGKTYQRDRVGYAGWADRRIDQATRRVVNYSGVEGRIAVNDKPVASVRVHAYSVDEKTFEGEGLTFSAPTGIDGYFFLPLRPGRYQLAAKADFPSGAAPELEPEVTGSSAYYIAVTVEDEVFTLVNIPLMPGYKGQGE